MVSVLFGGRDCTGGVSAYAAGTTPEHSQLLGRGLKVLGRNDGLEDLLGDIPELLVLVAEENDDAVGLRVEAAGDVQDSLLDNLLDALLANCEVLV